MILLVMILKEASPQRHTTIIIPFVNAEKNEASFDL
jgi:hypothetical protein